MLRVVAFFCTLSAWLTALAGAVLVNALLASSVLAERAPVVAPTILGELPHDTGVFTQGLFLHRGLFYESAGLRGQSRLLITEPDSGQQILVHRLPPHIFAEGADLCGDEVVQLTWTSGLALRYEPDTLAKIGEFRYQGQGWGIACRGQRVVTSDGSANLTFRDPKTFKSQRTLTVTDAGVPVRQLNELEWAGGLLLANIWRSHRIAAIDPVTGAVRLWLDMSEVVRRSGQSGTEFVLNGIAWDAAQQRLYVTGKGWNRLYLIDCTGESLQRARLRR
ncbi:glutamine cyclotransferase [Thiorhodovibrio frisius]|uniref:Glutamine cyclotransferase n=2 Tax=Thiorhodovibrio frisius TaxID=631362 RepID=H8YWV5_9GAMM|nr:glutamine cyclotransferase [Thiorhodovibrio frisius]WPL22810.1 Glutamine cyclotransferase [Thiorhodovibrio frisius]